MKIFLFLAVTYSFISATYLLVNAPATITRTPGVVSIPASAFTERNSQSSNQNGSYEGSETGTSRSFAGMMFAPINLPHDSIITSFKCGSQPKDGTRVEFTLRRNEPQQANVDMAVITTAFSSAPPIFDGFPKGLTNYQFISTNSITSGSIDNSIYNYYIIASTKYPPFPNLGFSGGSPYVKCQNSKNCTSVNFCNISYTFANPADGAGKIKVTDNEDNRDNRDNIN